MPTIWELLTLLFVFLTFVMLFAHLLQKEKKDKKSPEPPQEDVTTDKDIAIEKKDVDGVEETDYYYNSRRDGPVVTFVQFSDKEQRIFVATHRDGGHRLSVYGASCIRLLWIAIEHQRRSIKGR